MALLEELQKELEMFIQKELEIELNFLILELSPDPIGKRLSKEHLDYMLSSLRSCCCEAISSVEFD